MIVSFHQSRNLLCLILAGLFPSGVFAATKQDYALETQKYLKDSNGVPRSTAAVRQVLDQNKTNGFGRGQVMIIRPMIIVGEDLKDQDLLNKSKDIVLASNKVLDDGVDDAQKDAAGQVVEEFLEPVQE